MSPRRRRLWACALALSLLSVAGCRAPLASMEHGGLVRSYLLHVPPGGAEGRPLLVVLHGGGGNPRQVARYTGFDDVADDEGFVVVYPGARDKNWNDGRDAEDIAEQRDGVDDVGFLTALVDALVREQGVDRSRVAVTGISNGAIMSYRLACERADVFAAIAPVVGGLAEPLDASCAPSRPIAVLAMNGSDDTYVHEDGGAVLDDEGRGRIVAPARSAARFARTNGCGEPPATTVVDEVPDDATRVETKTWSGCEAGGETVFMRFVGGGHTLPGTDGAPHEPWLGKASAEVDGARAIWRFVSRHRRE